MSEENVQEAQENGPEEIRAENPTVPKKEVDKLYREMKRWKERTRKAEAALDTAKEKDGKIAVLTGMVADVKIDGALKAAAAEGRAIDPEEVATFLKGSVVLTDGLEPMVVETDGTPRFGAEGEPLTVSGLVAEYLSAHPHHVRPTGSSGGGTTERSSAPEGMSERIAGASSFEELKGLLGNG